MAIENWKGRLVGEIRQNKLKAGLLLVAVAVACYYWIPLVGRLGRRTLEPSAVTAAPATAVAAPIAEGGVSDDLPFNWEKFQQWKSQCAWMRPQSWSLGQRDPFRPATEQLTQTAEANIEQETGAVERPTPAQLGLVLRSILCSPRGNWVNFNGQMYRAGDIVSLVNSQNQQARFRIVFIGPGHVDLECDGQWYRVHLDEESQPPPERLSISRNVQ